MKTKINHRIRSLMRSSTLGLFLVILIGGSLVANLSVEHRRMAKEAKDKANQTLKDLNRLGLMEGLKSEQIAELVEYQWQTGKTLGQILKEPYWSSALKLKTNEFKVTWYMSNPFQLLPKGLQDAIRKRKSPFKSREQVWDWCNDKKFPLSWKKALKSALVETTPNNLWRASRGQRPFAHNGEYLRPIVIDHGQGLLEVKDGGHIATDPKVIPLNSEVFLVVKIKGEEKILKVIAGDIGGGIKGNHIDLPIYLNPHSKPMPHTEYPSAIRNPNATILMKAS